MRLGHRILLLLFLSFTLPQVASAAADGENFQDWYADRPYTSFEFLYANNDSEVPAPADYQAWSDAYGLEGIPVAGPPEEVDWLLEWEGDGYIPTIVVLGPDMRVLSMDLRCADCSTASSAHQQAHDI